MKMPCLCLLAPKRWELGLPFEVSLVSLLAKSVFSLCLLALVLSEYWIRLDSGNWLTYPIQAPFKEFSCSAQVSISAFSSSACTSVSTGESWLWFPLPFWFRPFRKYRKQLPLNFAFWPPSCCTCKVSFLGVVALWVDYTLIPADLESVVSSRFCFIALFEDFLL